jgi:hypothetical protein
MNSNTKRNKIFALCVIVLLAVLLALLLFGEKRGGGRPGGLAPAQKNRKDTLFVAKQPPGETPKETATVAPLSRPPVPPGTKTGRRVASPGKVAARESIDTTATAVSGAPAESAAVAADTTGAGRARACAADTTPPWVYPDPSGGLHRHPVGVVLMATKPCVVEWKRDSAAPYSVYRGETIPVAAAAALYFKAHDSCGNVMEERQEYYEISVEEAVRFCPPDMEYVKAGQTRFCIDRYEWPNKFKAAPRSFISLYGAVDSCVSVGKRLCTSDEWTLACTGPYGWKYPYGNVYEPRACVSHDTTARPSGSKPECRGYFEVFDMAGNLAEWTNTRSDKNPRFFNVRGGFWESGPHTGCFDVRYSYYPQNRHNPVGFRCCKAATSP